MSGHTPGPWSYSGRKGWYDIHGDVESGPDEKWICEIVKHSDARLIAAAPDLLDALKAVQPHMDGIICYASTMGEHEPNRIAVQVAAAIAKATEES